MIRSVRVSVGIFAGILLPSLSNGEDEEIYLQFLFLKGKSFLWVTATPLSVIKVINDEIVSSMCGMITYCQAHYVIDMTVSCHGTMYKTDRYETT